MTAAECHKSLSDVVARLCPAATLQFPAAVWDNTGTLVGAVITLPTRRGGVECTATASFSFPVTAPEALILPKVTAACNALTNEVSVAVRKVKDKRAERVPQQAPGALRPEWDREEV